MIMPVIEMQMSHSIQLDQELQVLGEILDRISLWGVRKTWRRTNLQNEVVSVSRDGKKDRVSFFLLNAF